MSTPEQCRAYYQANKEKIKAKTKAWTLANKEHKRLMDKAYKDRKGPEWLRDKNFRRLYGITVEQWDQMFLEQQGKCKICQYQFASKPEANTDHCHTTGFVRGLLCGGCNKGIGYFTDNPDYLIKASEYLRRFIEVHKNDLQPQ